jgi:hypothetical protein
MGKLVLAGVSLAAILTVAGCVVEAGVSASTAAGVAVGGPPPPPLSEVRPAPPSAQAVWIAGYWHWTGMQYTWIPGHWELERPGVKWRGPRYTIRDGVYFYEPGGWTK